MARKRRLRIPDGEVILPLGVWQNDIPKLPRRVGKNGKMLPFYTTSDGDGNLRIVSNDPETTRMLKQYTRDLNKQIDAFWEEAEALLSPAELKAVEEKLQPSLLKIVQTAACSGQIFIDRLEHRRQSFPRTPPPEVSENEERIYAAVEKAPGKSLAEKFRYVAKHHRDQPGDMPNDPDTVKASYYRHKNKLKKIADLKG